MSGPAPQPGSPSLPDPDGLADPSGPVELSAPVADLDRTGGYLGATGAAALVAASRGTPASWRLLLRRPMFYVGAAILLFWVACAIFG